MDLLDEPEECKKLFHKANQEFVKVYDHFDSILKSNGQYSVTWMGIPSQGKMHIPSCDFATLISKEHFEEFCLPNIVEEVKSMDHNIFHLDGKGVAKNLDVLLEIPEINAIQFVQGVGEDRPLMQWSDDIHKIQSAGKSVILDIHLSELAEVMDTFRPEGVYLCIEAAESIQPDVIRNVESWTNR